MTALDVIEGREQWSVEQGDLLRWLPTLPADSVDLVLCSPPYERARLYLENGENLGVARDTEEWVAWMVQVCHELRRVCKGLCALVVEGQTRNYRYTCSPFLLMAELHRAGFHLRKPPIYRRVGIPGSGGPDWWRNDYEPIVCFGRGGRLPWSDNTATGHPPKWAPGGEMSHRVSNGARINEWGRYEASNSGSRKQNGQGRNAVKKNKDEKLELGGKSPTKRDAGTQENGDAMREQVYLPPALANPGNVVQERYTAQEVTDILGQPQDVIDCVVGGGQMGSNLASDNEAPFPEDLCEAFVRSFCPPGGIVLDPFAGSGTTLAVALKWGRRAIGCDLRQSQVDLTTKRIKAEAIDLFTGMES